MTDRTSGIEAYWFVSSDGSNLLFGDNYQVIQNKIQTIRKSFQMFIYSTSMPFSSLAKTLNIKWKSICVTQSRVVSGPWRFLKSWWQELLYLGFSFVPVLPVQGLFTTCKWKKSYMNSSLHLLECWERTYATRSTSKGLSCSEPSHLIWLGYATENDVLEML